MREQSAWSIVLWLLSILLLIGLFTLFLYERADAAHNATVCGYGTSDGVNAAPNPDTFLAVALLHCDPPPEANNNPDAMSEVVFWDWFDWSAGTWKTGDVYDMAGCYECTHVKSLATNDVPIGTFMGINCRRAETVHLVWHHADPGTRVYYYSVSDMECR